MQTELQKIARSRNWLKMRLCAIYNRIESNKVITAKSENVLIERIDHTLFYLIDKWDDNTKKILKDIKEKLS